MMVVLSLSIRTLLARPRVLRVMFSSLIVPRSSLTTSPPVKTAMLAQHSPLAAVPCSPVP